MIPRAYITEWSNQVPWQTNEQVEQDQSENNKQDFEIKMKDDDFLGDITALIRPDEIYDPKEAFEILTEMVLEKM